MSLAKLLEYFKQPPFVYNQSRKFGVNYNGVRTFDEKIKYPSNFIKTSRYTLLTFLPLSLLMQFQRYANIYFLAIAIIQSIKILSPLNPFSAIAPLIFVLGLSMVREGYEDYYRHESDNEVNATATKISVNNQIRNVKWADIKVGDLVFVEENEAFPSDLLVLGTSIPSGVCYIETSSLDGEKNLKNKSSIKETQEVFTSFENYQPIELHLNCQIPSQLLSEYEGSIEIGGKQITVGAKQLLLRGAYLRNTQWIIGAVVYTGQDTKVMRNSEPGRVKQSQIEATMNKLILCIFSFQVCLCFLSAGFCYGWESQESLDHWYLQFVDYPYSPVVDSVLIYFSYFLLYNTMIPISLIVSLEFVKVFQSYFIGTDEEMYVAQRDRYASVKTTTINEELGQVEYIFSDKTGTLTCNQMEFKYCMIGYELYGEKVQLPNDMMSQQMNNGGKKQTQVFPYPEEVKLLNINQHIPHKHSVFNFQDEVLSGIIKNQHEAGTFKHDIVLKSDDEKQSFALRTQKDLVDYYFFLLASAHECLYQIDKNGDGIYQGPSPDEITLVDAASHFGFRFLGASASQQVFEIQGVKQQVDLLYSFEFDSDRKRMSAIVRYNGIIRLLTKGADNIIKARLSKGVQPFLQVIDDQLDKFSRIGLRTLLMATKIISEQEFEVFNQKYNSVSGQDALQQRKEISLFLNQFIVILDQLIDGIEKDLFLIGASAVEDKLQPQVPETIADFLRANIKVWMLTGDKLETAENIAISCKLIQGDMTVMRLAETNKESVVNKIKDNKETFELCMNEKRKKCLLVEGGSLAIVLDDPKLTDSFVFISQSCESVVCCRVTPKQKAQVVKLIKNSLNKITLAIGDGANDVNMIQEAHIGIGLYGNEGMRAVQSSDFALGEFRCLWRLLFVHGHWSYVRISEMILYFFYKNMIFTVPQFLFSFYNAFSAQSVFDDWYITFYNMIFTALPLIIRATFDQDVNYRQKAYYSNDPNIQKYEIHQEVYLRNKFPLIYYVGQDKTIFTIPNYLFWAFQGAAQGLIVFFAGKWAFNFVAIAEDGFSGNFAAFSVTIISAIIFVVDLKICLYTKFWTWLNVLSVLIFSLLVYFIYMILSNYYIGSISLYTPLTLMNTPHFWILIFLISGIVFLFELFQGEMARQFFKTQVDGMRGFITEFNQKINQFKVKRKFDNPEANNFHHHYGGSFWEELKKEEHKEQGQQQIPQNQG